MQKAISIIILCVLILSGCKEKSISGPEQSQNNLTVSFVNPLQGEAHIILHSLDGKEAISIQKIGANENAVFHDINDLYVTFTAIFQDTSNIRFGKIVRLITLYHAPVNRYVFYGPGKPILGYANVTFEYPDSDFTRSLISIPDYGVSSGMRSIYQNLEVKELCSNDKLTLFASLINTDRSFGFYGWLQDQTFKRNTFNNYSIKLIHPFEIRSVSTNIPVTGFSFGALINPFGEQKGTKNIYFWQDTDYKRQYADEFSNLSIFYALDFSADYYQLRVFHRNHDERYSYIIIDKDIPSSITIPSGRINASYNDENGTITQISLTGNADYISGFWSIQKSNQFYITWSVLSAPDSLQMARPLIPEEIMNQYDIDFSGDYKVDLLMSDFDTIDGYYEYLKKDSEALEQNVKLYKKRYYFIKYNLNNTSDASERLPSLNVYNEYEGYFGCK